jgi:glycolate oxidase FAD binding subunit
MEMIRPADPPQLAQALREYSTNGKTIRLGGNFSKDRLGAPVAEAAVTISTSAMTRLLEYEPRDLTISVEAGMPWRELERIVSANRQMIPLDPGWEDSTVGGVVAANLSGPRRRQYGTARDMIIGMKFATLEGKLVESGGMVVKNVAGLDMAKLMIGSFGTLAAIAVVNFKLFPVPEQTRTFVREFQTAAEAFAERDRILGSVMQPAAIDVVNFPAGCRLLIEAGGNASVIERFATEFEKGDGPRESSTIAQSESSADCPLFRHLVWNEIRDFTPRFLREHPRGAVRTLSMKLTEMPQAMAALDVPAIARAGSGVLYAHYPENAPEQCWSGDFGVMERIKNMFDPQRLLNRGRLYGRI